MEIIGVGTDIVEVKRIASFVAKKSALERVFSEMEIAYCLSKKNKYEHFAVRFAAKEAFLKAIPFTEIALKDIEVNNLPSGAPVIICKDKRLKKIKIHLSLSHCKSYATAVVVAVK